MRERVRDLKKRGDALFTKRGPLLSLWQTLCQNFHVMRADFTRVRFMSEEFASFLQTSRPLLAHRDLSNAIPAMMRPRDRQWLFARTHDNRVNEMRGPRAWLDWLSEQQFRHMYDPRAGLVRSCKEVDGDYSAIGNGVMTVDPNEVRDGYLIRSWHPRDVVWTEGYDLKINQVYHRRQIAARDIDRLWPKTRDARIAEILKEDPDRELPCMRIVIPVGDYDAPVKNKERTPFVSIYIDTQHETILEEVPQRRLGYVIPRWQTVSGSQYAYSPAAIFGLPDARNLQRITLTMLEAGEKATDPPTIAAYEALQGGVNLGAGMINWFDPDYDERTGEVLRPMDLRFDGIRYGAEREERVAGELDAVFFLNQIRLPQITKEMTAFEASKLYEEFQRNSLPLLEPIEVDYNGGLADACFEVGWELGLFGSPHDVPEEIRGLERRWEFETPLKAAAEQGKVFSFQAFTDTLERAMRIDPKVRHHANLAKATRAALIGTGGADWMNDEKHVEAAMAAEAQQEQQAANAQKLAAAADVAGRAGAAVEQVANAKAAAQQAGVT